MKPHPPSLALILGIAASTLVSRAARAQLLPTPGDLAVTCPTETMFKKNGKERKGTTEFGCWDKADHAVYSGSVDYANVRGTTGTSKNLALVFGCPPETNLNVSDRSDYSILGASYAGFECKATNGYDVIPAGWVKNEINKWSSDVYEHTEPVYANGRAFVTLTVYRDGKTPAP